jgi:hypothetical protein
MLASIGNELHFNAWEEEDCSNGEAASEGCDLKAAPLASRC